jgi:hypothetical protein
LKRNNDDKSGTVKRAKLYIRLKIHENFYKNREINDGNLADNLRIKAPKPALQPSFVSFYEP